MSRARCTKTRNNPFSIINHEKFNLPCTPGIAVFLTIFPWESPTPSDQDGYDNKVCITCSRTSGSGILSGFNATAPTVCQFLVCPDQREGFLAVNKNLSIVAQTYSNWVSFVVRNRYSISQAVDHSGVSLSLPWVDSELVHQDSIQGSIPGSKCKLRIFGSCAT